MPLSFKTQSSSTALLIGGGIGTVVFLYFAKRAMKKPKHVSLDDNGPAKTALIVGGGIGGLTAIAGLRKLDPNVTIVLVEPKEYVEIHWASYRSPFEEWVAEGSLISLQRFCREQNVNHVKAIVTKLTKTAATLDNGDIIEFDVCTVATGAGAHWPGLGRGPPSTQKLATRQGRLEYLKEEGRRILNANHILIVGGGLIGTELAGDVAAYAQKDSSSTAKVSLVHSGSQLCPVMSKAAAAKVHEQLESLGVKVYLNDKASKGTNDRLVLQSGKALDDVDITLWTTGFVPLNDLLKDIPQALDDKGWIQTDPYFRVDGCDGKIFAIGDCTTTLPNAGNQVMRNVGIIGNNLKCVLDGKDSFKPFYYGPEAYVNTTGPDCGVMYSSMFWTRYFFPWLKNKTMFFMSPKDTLGLRQ